MWTISLLLCSFATMLLFMSAYLTLPALFLKFWFYDAPIAIAEYFFSLNSATLHFLSIPLLLRTFFKPLKNEYRQGLVAFSIAMGIVIKALLLFVDLVLLSGLVLFEIVFLISFLLLPLLSIQLLFLWKNMYNSINSFRQHSYEVFDSSSFLG